MYKIIISLIISTSIANIACAQSGLSTNTTHDIPGITIVSRAKWGADESLKYSTQPVYQQILKNKAKDAEYISKLRASNSPKLKSIQAKQEKKDIANLYIKNNFPQERYPTQTIGYEMDKTLRRPFSYQKKTKFIIHHTVTDASKLLTQQDVYIYLQKLQKLHSLTRGRGDIGYNYLIGPEGTIYEGRAGGEGVVGAHATWNNFESIGIALIGNFEGEQVPDRQIESLIKLITQLSIKYNINPKKLQTYHRDSTIHPYIQDIVYPGIIGHTHAGKTQCPGKNLLDRIDYIRSRVYTNLNLMDGAIVSTLHMINHSGSDLVFSGVLQNMIPTQCLIDSSQINLVQCRYVGSDLLITVKPQNQSQSYRIQSDILKLVYPDGHQFKIILWYQTLPSPIQQLQILKSSYIDHNKRKGKNEKINKIVGKIKESDIPRLSQKDVSVLLYASSLLEKHTILCDKGCILTDQDHQRQIISGAITLWKTDTTIKTSSQNKKIHTRSKLQIKPIGVWTNITNTAYTRAYLGTITFSPGQIKKIDGNKINTILITNQLSFRDYLYGIAEEDNKQHIEKMKTLAILTKNYALFYLHPDNIHPSIIPNQGYHFIDDPRIFQKYAGYNFQKEHPIWIKSIDDTWSQRVLYQDNLVLLPYYHCNAGFTRSAKEQFGWIDTAYLSSILDSDGKCEDHTFQGHGVGLSGRGAQIKAQNGEKYPSIIQFYYPSTKIINIYTISSKNVIQI